MTIGYGNLKFGREIGTVDIMWLPWTQRWYIKPQAYMKSPVENMSKE